VDRANRIAQLWSWLPAFRAVAECEHLPTAARTMNVSPSALSRSVTQLEAALGHRLFRRDHRRLELEPAGQELLAAVRDAMRRVDDALGKPTDERPRQVRVAGDPAWIGLVIAPAATGFELEHVDLDLAAVRESLLRGQVDLVVVEQAIVADDLVVDQLGPVAHRLFGLRGRPFAICTTRPDAWPSHEARTIALRASRLETVLASCQHGAVQALLPVVLARPLGLRAHPTPRLPAGQLYLVRRRPLGTSAVEQLVPAVRDRTRKLLG
jgi:DNA-binding transcriptional LysR family regulator